MQKNYSNLKLCKKENMSKNMQLKSTQKFIQSRNYEKRNCTQKLHRKIYLKEIM